MTNATAWQLWNDETRQLAKQTNRLIFVSIGYSACHWCHVMGKFFGKTHRLRLCLAGDSETLS